MEKEVELKRVSFKFKIDGTFHHVKKPNLKLIRDFQNKQKELEKGEGDTIQGMIDFLAGLGLKPEVSEELDGDMLTDIVETVTGQKKSS